MNTTEDDHFVKTVTVVHFVNIIELSRYVKIVMVFVFVHTRESKQNVDCVEMENESKSKELFMTTVSLSN